MSDQDRLNLMSGLIGWINGRLQALTTVMPYYDKVGRCSVPKQVKDDIEEAHAFMLWAFEHQFEYDCARKAFEAFKFDRGLETMIEEETEKMRGER